MGSQKRKIDVILQGGKKQVLSLKSGSPNWGLRGLLPPLLGSHGLENPIIRVTAPKPIDPQSCAVASQRDHGTPKILGTGFKSGLHIHSSNQLFCGEKLGFCPRHTPVEDKPGKSQGEEQDAHHITRRSWAARKTGEAKVVQILCELPRANISWGNSPAYPRMPRRNKALKAC